MARTSTSMSEPNCGRCESTLEELEAQVAAIRQDVAKRAAERRSWEARMTRMVEDEKIRTLSSGGGNDGGNDDLLQEESEVPRWLW